MKRYAYNSGWQCADFPVADFTASSLRSSLHRHPTMTEARRQAQNPPYFNFSTILLPSGQLPIEVLVYAWHLWVLGTEPSYGILHPLVPLAAVAPGQMPYVHHFGNLGVRHFHEGFDLVADVFHVPAPISS
jgi:hypothetical protein